MRTEDEIERVLEAELDGAKIAYDKARKEWNAVLSDIPSGIPYPDWDLRIMNATKATSLTMNAYALALRELSDFLLRGDIPERFKER